MDKQTRENYLEILRDELIPALGCTEPIAIAYAAAKARDTLGAVPDEMVVRCSGNIIKNVKGVIVPGTGNMKGIETSAILGALVGGSDRKLEVLSTVDEAHVSQARSLLQKGVCRVELIKGSANLHIILTAVAGDEKALVEIRDSHTNIVRIEHNDNLLYLNSEADGTDYKKTDRSRLSLSGIYDFALSVDIHEIEPVLSRQVVMNTRIAEEGLMNSYGLNVGSGLIKHLGNDINTLAKAMPAAGSDARMTGCELPVVINSGSGNQGMTVSLPVIAFARHLNASDEKLYRALALSNLIAIHLKSGIGKLSAYCGVVSAACGSGAAITYLHDGDFHAICRTVTNTLGNVSGIVCDGAKASCAAKIASAVDAALMAHYLACDNSVMEPGDGIIDNDVESTIYNVGLLARNGMRETDVEILEMMI